MEWYRQFAGAGDHRKELAWRDRFSCVGAGGGLEVYNFYLSTEEFLRKYDGNYLFGGYLDSRELSTYCFVKQEKFKGTET
ncbi:MAG: hypothetical protein GXP32_06125 [Kiritimatiellaeota bacterium]|nr:hypothetical protein [Kiritimatiellota bacterium]